jgi:flagellar hook-associated protein 1 FlgK
MSITNMLNTALSGMFTAQASMRTTANNISNVNTIGYQRQILRQENIVTGGNSAGVRVTDIQRVVDKFLTAAGLKANSDTQAASVQREFHDRFQAILGDPNSGTTISARIDKVFGDFASLTLNPADRIVRQASLESVTDLAIEISRLSQNIQDLRNDASQRIEEDVRNVNEALTRIHQLNPLIIRQKALGAETAGLETQRDLALADLSKSIDVKTIGHNDGSVTVSTSSGVTLVDQALRQIEYLAPGVVTADTRFSPITIQRLDNSTGLASGSKQDFDGNVISGSIRGLLDMRDGDLRNLSLALGEFSSTFTTEVNRIHNSFSSFPPPNSLTGEQTIVNAAHATNFTGKVTFAVTDASGQVVSETLVDFDGANPADYTALVAQVNTGLGGNGTLALTNGVMSFTAANTANGVVIKDDATAPSARGGKGFSHFFGMNNLMESKVSGDYKTGLTGGDNHNIGSGTTSFQVRDSSGTLLRSYTMAATGTTFNDQITAMSAASALGDFYNISLDTDGQLVFAEKPGFNNLQLSVPSDTTQMNGSELNFSSLFGIGDRFIVEPSRNMNVKEDILLNPEKMALASFNLTAGVGNVALSKGDQSGALAFHTMQNGLFKFDNAGELANLTVTFSQYSAAFLANSGLMGARATARQEDNLALKIEIDQRNSDISGVNLDEELSNMIIMQTSFNAAARLIRSADEMMQTLIDSV